MVKSINQHIYAIRLGIQQLAKGHYWPYLLPAVVVFFIYYYLSYSSHNETEEGMLASIPLIGKWLQSGMEAISSFFSWMMNVLYQFTILTLLSPFNCLLSEKVDNDLTGNTFSGGLARIIADLGRALLILILGSLMYLVFAGLWWLLSWVLFWLPFIDTISNVVYFLIAAFFVGFSFYDFSLERYGIGTGRSWNFGFSKMTTMLITGSLFSMLCLIPHLGILLAPFLLTIISTIVYLQMEGKLPSKKA